jgi:hypothetical protein
MSTGTQGGAELSPQVKREEKERRSYTWGQVSVTCGTGCRGKGPVPGLKRKSRGGEWELGTLRVRD